ncbi:MAG: alkaline phosphatase family protein [Bdellovibrionales bacterium]
MKSLQFKRVAVLVTGLLVFCLGLIVLAKRRSWQSAASRRPWRLYWLVPDGLRADPGLFNMYRWAEEGKLPNIKRMMDEGSYGYSIPVFPSHTPVNFATLFTGTLPQRHGVADGPIRIPGYPLSIVPRSGFSSIAKSLDPFWYTLEQAGWVVS